MNLPRTERISTAFGMAAAGYDEHAQVQHRVAQTLSGMTQQWVAQHRRDRPLRILEIGCGTGALTYELCARFPDAEIVATDISAAMLDVARRKVGDRVEFRIMDGEHPDFEPNSFDLIISSLVFQWFADISGALERLYAVVSTGGLLAFSTMGRRSFTHWREAHAACGLEAGTPDYPAMADVEAIVRRIGNHHLCEEECRTEFGNARGLLRHLKGIGATVPKDGRGALGPAQLRSVMRAYDALGDEDIYHIIYGRIVR